MSESIFASEGESFPVLPSPALAHRLSGNFPEYVAEAPVLREGDGYLKGYHVLKTSSLTSELAREVVSVLTDPVNYGDRGRGAMCFFPGFGFTFGEGQNSVVALVCLECSWVMFYSGQGLQSIVPSPAGEARLRALYERVVA